VRVTPVIELDPNEWGRAFGSLVACAA